MGELCCNSLIDLGRVKCSWFKEASVFCSVGFVS